MTPEPAVPPEALAAIRAPFFAEGAVLADPPVVQPLNLFLDLAGETMRARLFIVQAEGREEACLRPDLTIPVARAHVASGASSGRYVYEGKAFRAAPADGAGHPEEFLQVGLELYEAGEPVDQEALIAGLAWRAASAGGRTDLTLRLGDPSLFSAFLIAIGVEGPTADRLRRAFGRRGALSAELKRGQAEPVASGGGLSALLRGLPETEAAEGLAELWALAGIQPVGGRPASEIVHRLIELAGAEAAPRLTTAQAGWIEQYLAISDRPDRALAAIRTLAQDAALSAAAEACAARLESIAAQGPPRDQMTFAAGFGRSFGYYDGLLFDVVSRELGEDRPVAGGGRYDSLLKRLGSKAATGAVGCMVRPARAWKGTRR